MVNSRVNMVTGEELYKYARQFNFQVTKTQAEQVANFLRGKNFDIFDDKTRAKIIKEVAKICGPQTARELNKLFIQWTK